MMNTLRSIAKSLVLSIVAVAAFALSQGVAKADNVVFSTTGTFSAGSNPGTSSTTFGVGAGNTTTLTFGGTANNVFTPAGVSFGDILATSTVPAGNPGPAITGNFTLNISQTIPSVGNASLVGSLSGTLGFNMGVTTLTFNQTSVNIGGIVYTVNPVYTIALPSTGVGGAAGIGTTTLQGTVTGSAIPEPTSMMLLGTGLLGVAGAMRRRFKRS